MRHYARITVTAVILLFWSASFALAAPSVSVIPSGGTTFIVQGSGMDGIAGMDLVISYDTSLSGPSVSQGGLISGALLAANTANTGTIKIAIISTRSFSGSGPIATVTFAKGSGNLKLVSVNMIDSKGSSVGSAVTTDSGFISSPGIPFSTPSASTSQTTQTGSSATSSPSRETYLGSVSMPTDTPSQSASRPVETTGIPSPPPADTSAAAAATPEGPADKPAPAKNEEPKKTEESKQTTYTGVLERFRTYQGEKSPAILAALFNKEVATSISQSPPVALCDGSTNIKITVRLSSSDERSPNFALNGATLISLKKNDESGTWTLEALPRANAVKASLTILNGNEVIEFPLTVAPPLKATTISEADFATFLKNNGKAADLNNDGNRDYVDDYIYTANYLVRKNSAKPNLKK